MKPGFDFDRSPGPWHHDPGMWHDSIVRWFHLPPWVGGLAFATGVAVYLLPAAVALWRGHPNRVAIVLLNILLGWTFVGWALALVWASTRLRPRRR